MTNPTQPAEGMPERWQLVPVEPTEEMWTAGRDPVMYRDLDFKVPECMASPPWRIHPATGKVELDQSKGTTAVHVWRAMLAAAPKAPPMPEPFHPDASHIHPDYRDGWNDALAAVLAAQGFTKE